MIGQPAPNERRPTPVDASRALSGWGFLVQSDLPDRPGPAFLLVALRPRPELDHFDAESIEFWVTHAGAGHRERLTRTPPRSAERDFSWGTIRIVDRLDASNTYLTFGGSLSTALVEDAVIAVFTSPVPLLRRGGHSQVLDEAAANVGAFFARLMIAVDYTPGFEARLAAARPIERYAAFIADLVERHRSRPDRFDRSAGLWSLARTQRTRIAREDPIAWRAGLRLLAEIVPADGATELA